MGWRKKFFDLPWSHQSAQPPSYAKHTHSDTLASAGACRRRAERATSVRRRGSRWCGVRARQKKLSRFSKRSLSYTEERQKKESETELKDRNCRQERNVRAHRYPSIHTSSRGMPVESTVKRANSSYPYSQAFDVSRTRKESLSRRDAPPPYLLSCTPGDLAVVLGGSQRFHLHAN